MEQPTMQNTPQQTGWTRTVYYTMQDGQDGQWISYSCDFMRTVSRSHNFLITETNAQGRCQERYKIENEILIRMLRDYFARS